MAFHGLKRWRWFPFGITTFVLLMPVLLALMAPALAPVPVAGQIGWQAPPLPDREKPLPGFQDLLDPLPLIVRDLRGRASGDLVEAYDKATLSDPQPSRDMFDAAGQALRVPREHARSWNSWVSSLSLDSSTAVSSVPFPDDALRAMQDDPRYGDRISNFAVALYFVALTDHLERNDTHDPRYISESNGALRLLDSAIPLFPDNRSLVLNYAFLSSFSFVAGTTSDPTAILVDWLADHPEDHTALHLLVYRLLLSNDSDLNDPIVVAGLIQLTESSDAEVVALGHSLLGDLKLGSAYAQREVSPVAAQESARQALAEYDKALVLSADPFIYVARTETLEFLGNIPAAIETQERAAELHPDSLNMLLRLGDLYWKLLGDEAQIRDALEKARGYYREALTYGQDHIDPLLADVQFRQFSFISHPDQVTRASSYTVFQSPRTDIAVSPNPPMAGGGYIVLYDLIPAYDYVPSPSGALVIDKVMITSVALGEPSEVIEDIARLEDLQADGLWTGINPETLGLVRSEVLPAAQLVAALPDTFEIPTSLETYRVTDLAVSVLRYAGLPAQAAAICANAADDPDPTRQTAMLRCVGENSYLAGDHDVARQAFAKIGDPLYEGFLAQVSGDTDGAIRLYEKFLLEAQGDIRWMKDDIVMSWLGDAYLESGDAMRAVEQYNELIDRLTGFEYVNGPDTMALQRAYNNRGVARLSAHTHSGAAPDCSGDDATVCVDTLADFEAALAFDPDNPVYLMGKAWVERLQGDTEAATRTLTQAIEIDPGLFPAHNDLGVLAIHAGDTVLAREAFQDALAANPEYDLALWNLGVLEMQRGVSGVPRGQAYLAQAIVRDPSHISSGLSYRTDEEVYRVEFNERIKPGVGWSFASATSMATSAFGFLALLGLVAKTTYHFSENAIQDAASNWMDTAAKWVDARVGRIFSLPERESQSPWVPLSVTLTVLVVVTSWTALREAPGVAPANVFLALFAALVAVIVHEVGHRVAAIMFKAEIRPAHWGPGTIMALVLLPINLNAGPYPGQRVVCEDEKAAWWVHLSGPLANLAVGLGAYMLFLVQPMPGLRMIAVAQLAAIGYALLPFESLDGAALARSRPKVLGALATFVLVVSIMFTMGRL